MESNYGKSITIYATPMGDYALWYLYVIFSELLKWLNPLSWTVWASQAFTLLAYLLDFDS